MIADLWMIYIRVNLTDSQTDETKDKKNPSIEDRIEYLCSGLWESCLFFFIFFFLFFSILIRPLFWLLDFSSSSSSSS